MSKIILQDLYEKQAELDETVHKNHGESYKTTKDKRMLALLVEIGEFANATRCFKFWSIKPSESKERILDEFADGLHFFLSLGICINSTFKEYEIAEPSLDLTHQIIKTYTCIGKFVEDQSDANFKSAFGSFLDIIPLIDSNPDEIKDAYYKKLGENFHRQATNY